MSQQSQTFEVGNWVRFEGPKTKGKGNATYVGEIKTKTEGRNHTYKYSIELEDKTIVNNSLNKAVRIEPPPQPVATPTQAWTSTPPQSIATNLSALDPPIVTRSRSPSPATQNNSAVSSPANAPSPSPVASTTTMSNFWEEEVKRYREMYRMEIANRQLQYDRLTSRITELEKENKDLQTPSLLSRTTSTLSNMIGIGGSGPSLDMKNVPKEQIIERYNTLKKAHEKLDSELKQEKTNKATLLQQNDELERKERTLNTRIMSLEYEMKNQHQTILDLNQANINLQNTLNTSQSESATLKFLLTEEEKKVNHLTSVVDNLQAQLHLSRPPTAPSLAIVSTSTLYPVLHHDHLHRDVISSLPLLLMAC